MILLSRNLQQPLPRNLLEKKSKKKLSLKGLDSKYKEKNHFERKLRKSWLKKPREKYNIKKKMLRINSKRK